MGGHTGSVSGAERFNVAEWLLDRHVAAGSGAFTALRVQGRSVSYAELHDLVQRVAGGLTSLGVRAEERVLLVMLDSLEFVASFLGSARIGAIPLPVNPLLGGGDLGAIASDARAGVAIVSSERAPVLAELVGDSRVRDVVVAGDGDLPAVPAVLHRWEDFVSVEPLADVYASVGDSPGFWLCTSGTTGRPKLAMHRQADPRLAAECYAAEVLGVGPDDRCYSVAPIFHAYGLGNSLVFPFSVGAVAILEPARPPTPKVVGRVLSEERPSLFFSVPTSYAALLAADLPADAFSSVRLAVSAGEALPDDIFRRFRDRFGLEILDGIGSTELTHIFISNRPGRAVAGASGYPVTGYEVRLVDPDGHDVDVDTPGQLWVKGETAATGYWCRVGESRRTFVGDWTRTGDTYVRSADGVYRYVGRTDELFKVAGEWVSPYEVESVLAGHPAVLEAAVVGVPTSDGVLRTVAFVTLTAGTEIDQSELIEFCRPHLAGFKRPKQVTVLDEMPKTATGKIRRVALRDLATSERTT